MTTKLTPMQAARDFSKEHPEFEGVLKITSSTPKGKGGWGQTRKDTTFFVAGGKVAARRYLLANRIGANGICPVCGTLYLEPCMNSVVDNRRQLVLACPKCKVAHGFIQPTSFPQPINWSGYASRHATHDVYRVDGRLNICEAQARRGRVLVLETPIGSLPIDDIQAKGRALR